MNLRLPLLLLVSFAFTAQGQNAIGTKATLLPSGWTIFEEATGDLNRDSIADAAIIIENSVVNAEGDKARALLILLKNNKTDDTYTQICRADHVILGSESGGVLGEPFTAMEINKNVLRIDFDGGSNDKWETTHRYRYQSGALYVIGATYISDSQGVRTTYDYNLSSGKYIITKRDGSNQANNSTTTKVHKIEPPKLSTFEPDALWAILMPEDYATVSTCEFKESATGDCPHLIFDCGDFGNAALYLDESSKKLWSQLSNYKGLKFKISYVEKYAIRCEAAGEEKYKIVVGFKMKL